MIARYRARPGRYGAGVSLFGSFIAARTDRPLASLACVRRDHAEPGAIGEETVAGDWRVLQTFRGSRLDAVDVGEETGGPAVVSYVIESAVATLDCYHPDGPEVLAALNPSDAIASWDFTPEHAGTAESTTAAAVAWAVASGLAPDAGAIEAAVVSHVGPSGEGVLAFLTAVGIPLTPSPPLRSGPLTAPPPLRSSDTASSKL
jgi:hypothetical protein